MKRNIYLAQVSTKYGESIFLPYSVGLLQAYAQNNHIIRDTYDFKGFIVNKDPINIAVSKLNNPVVLGLSCYVWNWEYSKALAKAVKQAYPDCLIIMGGPQIPNNPIGFFDINPYVDLLVHGEGEITFTEILLKKLFHMEKINKSDFSSINGVSCRYWLQPESSEIITTPGRERTKNLSILPSPYLTEVFDELVKEDYDWIGSSETNRGCPYPCTFCLWGNAGYSKFYEFNTLRIKEELKWFGENKINYLYSCDANYGILERDISLTDYLIKTKEKYGYPKDFRACTAKNSSDRIFEISKRLHDAKMHKGTTLSLQSLDAHTLQTIKRTNMKINDFSSYIQQYRKANIATYTELIIGLPGETYNSFKQGIDTLLEAGQHEHINMYLLQCLPNSELSEPEYRLKHGLQTVVTPLLLQHSTPINNMPIETEEIVIATNTMSEEDWKKTFLFAWAVQTFHCMGLTRNIAIYLHKTLKIPYSKFYEALISWAKFLVETSIGQEYIITELVMQRALFGGSWGRMFPNAGNIIWPTEEASFLKLSINNHLFYQELYVFLKETMSLVTDTAFWDDLIIFQQALLISPYDNELRNVSLLHNWHTWMQAVMVDNLIPLESGYFNLEIKPEIKYNGDIERYAREQVWWKRKSGSFYHKNITESLNEYPKTYTL